MPPEFNPAVFVEIRFAMIAPYSEAFKDTDVARKWLSDRMPIFRNVCVPGLNMQSRKPDAVLLGYVDGLFNESQQALKAIDESLKPTPVFQKVCDDQIEEITQVFSRGLASFVRTEHTHVISIRLDNDDAIHKDYIKGIVDHFKLALENKPDATDFFASYPFGMQTDGKDFVANIYPSGPFQARMEATHRDLKGIYGINHVKASRKKNFSLIVKNTPYWIQYVHGSNVSNKIKQGSLRLTGIENLTVDFGLNENSFCARLMDI